MAGIVHLFGDSTGRRPSEQLTARLGVPVGHATILRTVKKSPRAHGDLASVRVAGIDDWAWKKGMNYGTVIVDFEQRQVVGLLADRSAASTAEWLKAHHEIEIVSRDRAGLSADGVRQDKSTTAVARGIADHARHPLFSRKRKLARGQSA